MLIYFAFTSLTTVGLGDIAPKSDTERLIIAFTLLYGVAIFSYFLGDLGNMILVYKSNNILLDDGEGLQRFFGVLKKFNYNQLIDERTMRDIEEYF